MIKIPIVPVTILIVLSTSLITGQTYGISGSFFDADNKSVSYSNYQGQYLFIEAFSTTCIHCQNFHPTLTQIYEAFKQRMIVLSISINPEDDISKIQQWNINYPSAWKVGYDRSFATQLQITSTPTTVLFSRSGNFLQQWVGAAHTFSSISTEIDGAIRNDNQSGSSTTSNPISPVPEPGLSGGSIVADIVTNPLFIGFIVLVVLIAIYFKFFDKPKKKETQEVANEKQNSKAKSKKTEKPIRKTTHKTNLKKGKREN